jgi:hypothetical protein
MCLVACVLCYVGGCVPPSQIPGATADAGSSGHASAPPSFAALPALPHGASGNTTRTHHGLLVARETLDATMPTPPADRSYLSLKSWIDGEFALWLERRRAQAEQTRARFELEAAPSGSERAVSHAALGLIHEDTALSLGTIPAPRELDTEPEVAAVYRELVAVQVDTFLNTALSEFRDCANEAYRADDDMRSWAEFCHARFDRLREKVRASRKQADPKRAAVATAQ